MDEEGIKLIVGLGNPGPQYEPTRHNVGYWLVETLAASNSVQFRFDNKFHGLLCRLLVAGRDLRLLKPATYMNRSGQSLAAVVRYFDISMSQVLVVHDELDLPVGALRLKYGGGHAGHNGLRNIVQVIGTRDFWRLRIGIDHPADRSQVVDYVLSRFSRDDETRIRDLLDQAEPNLIEAIQGKFQRAMNGLHSGC